jgi:hypothetical protein
MEEYIEKKLEKPISSINFDLKFDIQNLNQFLRWNEAGK